MYSQLISLLRLLSDEQRSKLLKLQILIVLMAFAEVAAVSSIGPFMALVADSSLVNENEILFRLFEVSGAETAVEFLSFIAIMVIGILAVAAVISTITVWRLSLYAQQVGAELSTKLYYFYMRQSWIFHTSTNSAQLTNKVAQECGRVINLVIFPLMQMNAKGVMIVVMLIALFVFDPMVAFSGLLIFGTTYWLLFLTVRKRLVSNGRLVTESNRTRFKLLNEGFGGIKDTLLLGRQEDFYRQFRKVSYVFARALGTNSAIAQVPKYAVELLAYGGVLALVIYLLVSGEGGASSILPVLSVYALAGFKLLPAFQQVYSNLSNIRSNLAAFEAIKDDLEACRDLEVSFNKDFKKIKFSSEISIENVFYKYPEKDRFALKDFSLIVKAKSVVALVGESGSGKSTAIDILMGLIEVTEGCLKVDGVEICKNNVRDWQNSIGYVSQSIFLADSSIMENIAFGVPKELIDDERVKLAIKVANLKGLVDELPHGVRTLIGERGVQLSGGQRQRIAIARALYDDAEVLVLDEATSALDGLTEKAVMEAISQFVGLKTIIIVAHRLATVKRCDAIYLVKNGQIVDAGTYESLQSSSEEFRRMAQHA